jgi:alkylation response protein AidB-like acyl-CoA dehydrogenase
MIGLAQGALDHTIRYTRSVSSSAARSPTSRASSSRSRAPPQTSKREAPGLQRAARLRDAGRPFLREAAMCKLFSQRSPNASPRWRSTLYGGYGFVKDYPVEKLYRDAKIGQIYEGTSNLQLQDHREADPASS